MGLDMWIRRVEKVDLQDRLYGADELRSYSVYLVSDFERDPEIFKDLLPYVAKVTVENSYYDIEKIINDYNLPPRSHISCISFDEITVGGTWERTKTRKDVTVPKSTVNEKYIKLVEEPSYVFKSEEVAYWRKHYELQSAFYNAIENVDNCGYYILDGELIANLRDEFPEDMADVPLEDPTDTSALFYHEWY